MMGEIFTSPARPFYQSTAIMELHPIDIGTYTKFIRKHFLIASAPFTEDQIQKYYDGTDPLFPNTNWYKELIRDWAPEQQHNYPMKSKKPYHPLQPKHWGSNLPSTSLST